jgi:hypothetical protein
VHDLLRVVRLIDDAYVLARRQPGG